MVFFSFPDYGCHDVVSVLATTKKTNFCYDNCYWDIYNLHTSYDVRTEFYIFCDDCWKFSTIPNNL